VTRGAIQLQPDPALPRVGAAGTNGPVAVFLFGPAAPGGGRLDGVIAEGTITAADFTGPIVGASMDDLIAEMLAGNSYVNVHTNLLRPRPDRELGTEAIGQRALPRWYWYDCRCLSPTR
jgi:hypothetical protein